jgi:hypothetical protein
MSRSNAPSSSSSSQRKKRNIVDEDRYIEMLENVIEKNYFPHIPILEKQLEYMDNNETFDIQTLRNIYQELFPKVPLPKVPATSSSFSSSVRGENKYEEHRDISSFTIPEFFQSYMSEDNYSFLKIQEQDLQNFRRKYHWLYEPNPHLLLTSGERSQAHPALPAPNKTNIKKQRAGMLMLYYINDKVLSQEQREKLDETLESKELSFNDSRPNNTDYGQFRVRNSLMFYPDLQEAEKTHQIIDNDTAEPLERRNPILPLSESHYQLLLENNYSTAVEGREKDNQHFLVPSKPSSKIPSKQKVSTENSFEVMTPTSRSFSTDLIPRPASMKLDLQKDKIIQKENIYQSGISFIHEIDNYLRGGNSSNQDHPHGTVESPHTPTTVSSDDRMSNSLLQYPYLPRNSSNTHSSKNNINNNNQYGELSSSSLSNQSALHQNSLVSMSPLPIIGKGLLSSPIITWGKLLGPPILLDEGENDGHQEKDKAGKTHNNRIKNAGGSAQDITSSSSSSSQLFNPDLPHFYLHNMNQREKLGHQLDQKRVKKQQSSSSSTSATIFNKKDNGNNSIFRDSMSSNRSVSSIATGSSSKRLKLHEMSPAAQLLAKKVQNKLRDNILK